MGNPSPAFGKSVVNFGENSVTDFWENPSPTLGKSVTVFGEIRVRFWGNPSPCLGKTGSIWEKLVGSLGKTGWVFGINWLGFRERLAQSLGKGPVLGKDWLGLWEKRASFFGETRQKFARLACRNYFGVCVRDLYEMPQAQTGIHISY